MTTVKEAQETTIYIVNRNNMIEETNLYDHVMNFESENKLTSEYHEDEEIDEETGTITDNGKWRLRYHRVNRPSHLLDEEFETEEEADDEIFDRIYRIDFERANEDTLYFYSEEEARRDIIYVMSGEFDIDKDVAANIYRKQVIVFEERKKRAAILQAKATAERNERVAYLSKAVPEEAASIVIDDQFKQDIEAADLLAGMEKNNAHAASMKGLLSRNNIEKINSDFWQVFRILKAKAESFTTIS